MRTQLIKGSKREIAESIAHISGEVHEAIVFIDEGIPAPGTPMHKTTDIFVEMSPYMVDVPAVDDSREGIYTRTQGE